MIWTKEGTQIHAAPLEAGTPIIRRDSDTIWFDLTAEEALGLAHEITQAFGVQGAPSTASFTAARIVVENPQAFHAKETS